MVDRGFDNSDIVPSDVKVKMFCNFKCAALLKFEAARGDDRFSGHRGGVF